LTSQILPKWKKIRRNYKLESKRNNEFSVLSNPKCNNTHTKIRK